MSELPPMQTATYRTAEGPVICTYAPDTPCLGCGLPVGSASSGGPAVCPACDCGKNRDGSPAPLRLKGDRQEMECRAKNAAYYEAHPERKTTWKVKR